MPSKPDRPHRVRARALDGKPRDQGALNKLKSNQLGMPHLDIVGTNVPHEFIICASKDTHIELVRAKLGAAGFEEVEGDTTITTRAATPSANSRAAQSGSGDHRGGDRHVGGARGRGGPPGDRGGRGGGGGELLTLETNKADLRKKPYGFVSMPPQFTTDAPVWHDGTSSADGLSGEVRFEIEALTPLLVGWERGLVGDDEHGDWPIESRPEGQNQSMNLNGLWSGPIAAKKSVLCPLRAPWGERPVIIPGDSLKGLLRHELGALLGVPMERVAERSYSYRPNSMFAQDAQLIPRLARIPTNGVVTRPLFDADGPQARVPTRLELLPTDLKYDKKRQQSSNYYRFDDGNGAPYRGGQGAGEKLNSKRNLHKKLAANPSQPTETATLAQSVQDGYLATVRHLVDLAHGHFSERHPDVPNTVKGDAARARILQAAKDEVFQPGDLVWVEWDTEKKCIVSVGWHYYYRWAYTDSVRRTGGQLERHGLFPLAKERDRDADGAPAGLSAVRRLLGYTGDNAGDNNGSQGIGEGDHTQLMGRLFPNAAVEVVESGDTDDSRFLKPTFLKELGMPRPSAVEHYLKQPYHPKSRPSDRAKLVTYGDAAGYDEGGELAGRKFYLDRADAYAGKPWEDSSEANRFNDRSTLALEASKPGRRFRFTLRFRDLDPSELAAVLVALCPDQFKAALGGTHADGYCSKLGYARPLGWGSVQIEAKALLWLDVAAEGPTLTPEADLAGWVRENYKETALEDEWLAIHRRKHPDAADYPRLPDRDGNKNIYTFHTTLRAEHSRARRYRKQGEP
jgi:CRISPR-associated protein (TIGR03986 family)